MGKDGRNECDKKKAGLSLENKSSLFMTNKLVETKDESLFCLLLFRSGSSPPPSPSLFFSLLLECSNNCLFLCHQFHKTFPCQFLLRNGCVWVYVLMNDKTKSEFVPFHLTKSDTQIKGTRRKGQTHSSETLQVLTIQKKISLLNGCFIIAQET